MVLNNFEKHFQEVTDLNFREFYRIHKPRLMWHLSRWKLDLKLSEDYAQEAFVQALHKIDTWKKDKAQVHTWLFTIGDNLVKKDYRDKQKLPSVSLDKEYGEHSTLTSFISYDDGKEDQQWLEIKDKKLDMIYETILSLPEKHEKYKKVLIMREIDHMHYKDISEALSLNLSTIKSQIRKGRDILHKKLYKKGLHLTEHGLY